VAPTPSAAVDVLVVDDDEGVRSSVAEILRRARHTVAEAENGEAALDRLAEVEVGVLVVDIRMPRLDGLGLLRGLENPPPAIVISAYFVDDEVRRSLGSKVSSYLRKPFRPEHLLAAVDGALGGPRPSTGPAPGAAVDGPFDQLRRPTP
jgi:CheY-like chemotaxis protein